MPMFPEGSPEKRMSEMPDFLSEEERREVMGVGIQLLRGILDDGPDESGVREPRPDHPPTNSGSTALEIPVEQ